MPPAGGDIPLPESEIAHAVRVMRVQPGAQITLFDGRGNEAIASVISVDKRHCLCRSEAAKIVDRESKRMTHLAIALPKPERAKEMVERLTELGVATITPVVAERTQRAPSSGLVEKLRRAVIESSKQCGRNRLLEVRSPVDSETFFSQPSDEVTQRWIAHPDGQPLPDETALPDTVLAAIGPEGGWSDSELRCAELHDFLKVDLGSRILRIETAAAVIATKMM